MVGALKFLRLSYQVFLFGLRHHEIMNLNYNYKFLLAGAYKSINRYEDAIDLLKTLNGTYGISGLDADRVDNMIAIYKVLSNLYDLEDNLDSLSPGDRSTIDSIYYYDDYQAHAIASGLLYRLTGVVDPVPLVEVDTSFGIISKRIPISNDQIAIYPVPAKNTLYVRWMAASNETAQYQVTDLLGRQHMHSAIDKGEQEISIEGLAPGMYFITIRYNNGRIISQLKFIKE